MSPVQELCQAARPWTGLDVSGEVVVAWEDCGDHAVGRITGGCVHEHVRAIDVCASHLATLAGEQPIGCIACFEAGHECPMVIRVISPPDGVAVERE